MPLSVRVVFASKTKILLGELRDVIVQKRYSKEFKETIIKRIMSPHPVSASQLCIETGVSDVTLYKWRKDYQNRECHGPG